MKWTCFFASLIISIKCFSFTLITPANSQMRGWDKKNLVYHLNSQNCPNHIRFNIEEAMALWNSINTSQLKIELSPVETTDSSAEVQAGTFTAEAIIICDTNMVPYGLDPDFVAGIGNVSLNARNQINKAYLVLNVQPAALANISGASNYAAQIIIAHELGHTLGLGHSSDISALMYYSAGYKESLVLSEDDIDGFTYLYPRDEAGGDLFMSGCAVIKNNNNKYPFETLFLVLVFCLFPLITLLLSKVKKRRSIV